MRRRGPKRGLFKEKTILVYFILIPILTLGFIIFLYNRELAETTVMKASMKLTQEMAKYPVFQTQEITEGLKYSAKVVKQGAAIRVRNIEEELSVEFKYSPNWVNVQIKPTQTSLFEIPNEHVYNNYGESYVFHKSEPGDLIFFPSQSKFSKGTDRLDLSGLEGTLEQVTNSDELSLSQSTFNIKIKRKSDDEVLFDTAQELKSETFFCLGDLKSKFNQISIKKDENEVLFGIEKGRTTINQPEEQTKGQSYTANNWYQHHPFYVKVNKLTGKASGFYIHSSSPMDFFVRDTYITVRSISGILDLYIFEGPTVKDVIQQYHDLLGKPIFLPIMAFGLHQSRPGYNSVDYLKSIVENYNKNNFTLSGIWQDYNYMEKRTPFTVNSTEFSSEAIESINELKEKYKFKYIPVIEEGIKAMDYTPFDEGKRMEVFVKESGQDESLTVTNQAGNSTLINFFHPNASIFWENNLERLRKKLKFNALWINYDLPKSTVFKECGDQKDKERLSETYSYIPGDAYCQFNTDVMSGYFPNNFTSEDLSTGLNLYPLSGIMQSKYTYEYLRNYMKKRPLVVSKRSFPGSGQYAGTWIGDNKASWKALRMSIPAIMTYHMYGIPFVGLSIQAFFILSDSSYICEYSSGTSEELCIRLHQLASFMPLTWNHNSKITVSLENTTATDFAKESAQNALRLKEELILFHYSLLLKCIVGIKGQESKSECAYITPLGYHYSPSKNESIDIYDIKDQFMFGNALLVNPVVNNDEKQKKIYFPEDTFYDFYTGKLVEERDAEVLVPVVIEHIPVYFRGGHTIPMVQLHNNSNIDLHIALKKSVEASGRTVYRSSGVYILDDGESLHSYISSMMYYISIKVTYAPPDSMVVKIVPHKPKSGTSQYLYLTKYKTISNLFLYGYEFLIGQEPQITVIFEGDKGVVNTKTLSELQKSNDKTKVVNVDISI
ncbi:unnamed protein product [Moneuplotes crassus]|uniref:Uncharacterized protein n=3 Tax=Euplotes crassus TaxID=5936 RepID=A0AAD1XPK1_EUPCR|nr:unnamed protein product [Moneuplotes crassus]